MNFTPAHHRAKGARVTDCGRPIGMNHGRGLHQIDDRLETVLRDASRTTCEQCVDAINDNKIKAFRNKPLRSVKVGDRVRLIPDDKVKLTHNCYRLNPNSSLGIDMAAWHVVTEVLVTDGMALIGVEGSIKRVDMRRFTAF